jgi:hypothetical protein
LAPLSSLLASAVADMTRKPVAKELEEDRERFVNSAGAPQTPVLPPWQAARPADQELMHRWVNAQLDELDAAFDHDMDELAETQDWGPGTTQEEARRLWNLGLAKEAARQGDFTLLRRMFPELARFLNPPSKLGQGKRPRQPDYSFKQHHMRQAIDDVHRIRQIWAQHYGRWKRHYDDRDVSAEAIAAARHDLDVATVREAMRRGVRGLWGRWYFAKNTTPTSTK